MAGHSKWANIKHKKAKEDAKRGKAFTRLIREITVVARDGGGDPSANPRLRMLMEKAKEINMPQENVMRAVKKGTGELPGATYESCTYEGYGPNGITVIVETLTDNKNRTVAEMRKMFSTRGGSMGDSGSVSWMYDHLGVVRTTTPTTEDALLEHLMEFDVHDIKEEDDSFAIICDPKDLFAIKKALENNSFVVESAQLEWVAKNTVTLPDEQAEKAVEFLDALDDHDDVQNVYTNLG